MNRNLILICFLFSSKAVLAEDFTQHNVGVSQSEAKRKGLMLEKKINRSLFLPELSLTGGVGSEKILDNSNITDKGPFLYLDGKLNLYRGGRDLNLQSKTEKELTVALMEEELKKRELRIETFKKISEIKLLEKENALMLAELDNNKTQQKMAKKKVDAGLTTSVDLLDFDLKEELLQTELDKNRFKAESLKKEILALYAGKLSFADIEKNFSDLGSALDSSLDTSFGADQHPQMLIAKKRWESTQLSKKSAKAEYLPSVDFEAKYGQITPQEKLFGDNTKEHQVALSVTLPLFSGLSTSGKYRQAVIETTQAERELRQAELDLQTQKEVELKKIDLLKKNLASLERLFERATRYSELTISDYRRGVKNSPDVIAASDKKFEAQKKILETKLELNNTVFNFNETFKAYTGD